MDDSKRIIKLKEYLGISFNKIAEEVGIKTVQTLYDIKNGRHGISKDLAEKIQGRYLNINLMWLLTGEGNMLNEGVEASAIAEGKEEAAQVIASSTGKFIRYWKDVDVTATPAESFEDIKESFIPIVIPDFRDCTDAVNVFGDSMIPKYHNGDIIIFREWTENFIDFGNVYLVITRSGHKMVKYIRPGRDEAHVSCESENPLYAPFQVDKEDIVKLYIVKGSISRNLL